jgi:hypothetical protein
VSGHKCKSRVSPDARLNGAPVRTRPCGGPPIRCSLTPPTGSVVTTPACTFASEVSFTYAPGSRVVADPSINPVLARTPGAQSHTTPAPTIRFRRVGCSNREFLRSGLPLHWQLLFPYSRPLTSVLASRCFPSTYISRRSAARFFRNICDPISANCASFAFTYLRIYDRWPGTSSI